MLQEVIGFHIIDGIFYLAGFAGISREGSFFYKIVDIPQSGIQGDGSQTGPVLSSQFCFFPVQKDVQHLLLPPGKHHSGEFAPK